MCVCACVKTVGGERCTSLDPIKNAKITFPLHKTLMLNDILLSLETVHSNVCTCVCEDSWWRERERCTSLDPIKNAKITPPHPHLPSSANAQHCKVLGNKHIPSFLAAGSLLLSEEPWGFWESLACPAPCWRWLSCESQGQRRGWESPVCSLQTTQSVTKPTPATATTTKRKKKKKAAHRKPVSIKWAMFSTTAGQFYYKTAKAYHTYFLK